MEAALSQLQLQVKKELLNNRITCITLIYCCLWQFLATEKDLNAVSADLKSQFTGKQVCISLEFRWRRLKEYSYESRFLQNNPVDLMNRIQRLTDELPDLQDECEALFAAKQVSHLSLHSQILLLGLKLFHSFFFSQHRN